MRVIALLALCVAAVSAVPANRQKIAGGFLTTIDQYPTIVSLLYTTDLISYTQWCAGTILNNRAVLTAAHCTIGDAANRWRSRVGSTWANSGGVVHNTNTIINHPSYNKWTYDNDISIIHTATIISFGTNVQAASIAGSTYFLGDHQVVWAAGWGAFYSGGPFSEQLRHVQIWTVNQNVCRIRYDWPPITDNMLCAGWLDVGGRDQCQGDSGGPLYHHNVVVGVRSFGNGCGLPRYPGVNTRVSIYTSWIQSNA